MYFFFFKYFLRFKRHCKPKNKFDCVSFRKTPFLSEIYIYNLLTVLHHSISHTDCYLVEDVILVLLLASPAFTQIGIHKLQLVVQDQAVILFFTSCGSWQKSVIFSLNFLWKSGIQNSINRDFEQLKLQFDILVRWARSTAVA